MKYRSILFSIALTLFGACAFAGQTKGCGYALNGGGKTLILFVNGIMNSVLDACKSSAAMASAVNDSTADFDYWYNQTDGSRNDVEELRVQAAYSDTALQQIGLKDKNTKEKNIALTEKQKSDYYKILGGMYSSAVSNSDPVVKRVAVVSDSLKSLLVELATKYQRVVVVAHSQGNFYVESAFATLIYENNTSVVNKIRVVGVASVAATTPSNVYVTNQEDAAVYSAQKANTTPLNDGAGPIAYGPLAATDPLSQICDLSWKQTSGFHNFVLVYISDCFYSENRNKRTYKNIVSTYVLDFLQLPPEPISVDITLNSYATQTVRNGGAAVFDADMAISTIPISTLYDEVTMQGRGTDFHTGGVLRFAGDVRLMPQELPYIRSDTTIPAGTVYTFTFWKSGAVVGTKAVTLGVDIPFGSDLKSALFPFPLYKNYTSLCTKGINTTDMVVFPTDSLAAYQRLNLSCQNGANLSASSVDAKYRQFATFVAASASPYVAVVSPTTLVRGVPTTVSIDGDQLPSTTVFSIESVVCNGNYTRTAWSVWQTCTAQPGSNSSAAVWVKDGPNGNTLIDGDGVKRITIP